MTVYIVLWLASVVLWLWLIIKIAKSSTLMAVISFFFVPASIITLIQEWGDPETDIRVPFFLSLGVSILTVVVFFNTAYNEFEQAYYAEDAYFEEELSDGFYVNEDGLIDQDPEAQFDDTAVTDFADELVESFREKTKRAIRPSEVVSPPRLDVLDGSMEFEALNLEFAAFDYFEYLTPERALVRQAATGIEPNGRLMGALVHERASREEGVADLVVTLGWHPAGHVSLPTAPLDEDALFIQRRNNLEAQNEARTLLGFTQLSLDDFAHGPHLETDRSLVYWTERLGRGDRVRIDCEAIKFGLEGFVTISVAGLTASREELCLRTVRMVGNAVRFRRGYRHDDYRPLLNAQAPFDFAAVVAGQAQTRTQTEAAGI